MFPRVAATFFLLALPLLTIAADECGEFLHPYCCQKNSLTPRGYVGEQCTTLQSANDPCGASVLCCQQINDVGTAYYCGQPQAGSA